jgi:hypothetical protein
METIDGAWVSRVTSFCLGAEAVAMIARARCRPDDNIHYRYQSEDELAADLGEGARNLWPSYLADRAAYGHNDDAHVEAWRAGPMRDETRPFRFEDLNGKPEPEIWGPLYPKTASANVEQWRRIGRVRELSEAEKREHGAAVGDWIRSLNAIKPAPKLCLKYVRPNYAAKARAAFAAAAGADRREWAAGKAKSNAIGLWGLTIEQAYAQAMAEKAKRLAAGEPMREAA